MGGSKDENGYNRTLNLPRTDFPMRANLPQREPEMLRTWEEKDLYGQLRRLRQGKPRYVLHDGPPYANGNIHIGTALNKILKDFVVRFASMSGYDSPYVPGWDTHGLPIELEALKALGLDHHEVAPLELRRFCRDYALKYVDVQREQFKRLEVMGDWAHPYLTLDPSYEARQVEVFGEMARRGYIYKGLKSVHWCSGCETALAEAEVEYRDKRSPSIWVAFTVSDPRGAGGSRVLPPDARVVIWTTTPWTLPANVAIAVHPAATYAVVETEEGKLVLAKDLVEEACADLGLRRCHLLATVKGAELEGAKCHHPFFDRESVVVLAEYVALDEGTGCVHIAPGHGPEDFEVGRRYHLPVVSPIDGRGRFTAEAGWLEGTFYLDANPIILEELKKRGALLGSGTTLHSYPCCWRCKNPLLFRATEQWFASVEGFRDQALAAIDGVRWVPPWGRDRIRNMVKDRTDWCVSRQRAWGVPIPIFYCTSCGQPLITQESIKAVADLFRREGSDSWFRREAHEILPAGTQCACGGRGFRKETDIMDVWFDSGSSHVAVLEERPGLSWPADVYLEGSDQHRGWFQSSLLTSVATRGQAPYRTVITHGFVLDGEGRAMHKSLGNVIDPRQVIDQYGADVLRLWVAASDYRDDVRISPLILSQLSEVYRKIRNTMRFILGNLYDFDPAVHGVAYEKMPEVDRWALQALGRVVERATRAFREHEYHLPLQTVHGFCAGELSAFYLDVLKDRLYCSAAGDPARRAAQTVLYRLAHTLVRLLAPILPFTAEEVWQHLPKAAGDPWSVHLADWPSAADRPSAAGGDDELWRRWEILLAAREVATKALEEARGAHHIGSSLEAALDIHLPAASAGAPPSPLPSSPLPSSPPQGAGDEPNTEPVSSSVAAAVLQQYEADLPALFIVSQVRILPAAVPPDPAGQPGLAVPPDAAGQQDLTGAYLGWARAEQGVLTGLAVGVRPAAGKKCQRCWVYSETVNTDPAHPDLCARCAEVVSRY